MSKALRFSEKWFRRALWLIAFVFAGFLMGLGGLVVGDLPKVEKMLSIEDFIDKAGARAERATIKQLQVRLRDGNDAQEQSRLLLQAAQHRSTNARETFANWLATRGVTQQAAQDDELLKRTRELDVLKAREREAQEKLEKLEQANLDTRLALEQSQRRLSAMEESAYKLLEKQQRKVELKVFLYRLVLTLPLLAIAGWLFVKKRKTTHWPFVWGFILFALYAFFVELVPYLPSYGGYVRYLVGIVLTILVGHYAIRSMKRYLERQKAIEQLPDEQRRQDLSYDVAQTRLVKGICPGCERALDLKDPSRNYCVHCGICLFDECRQCHVRKNAFAHYCHACGADGRAAGAE